MIINAVDLVLIPSVFNIVQHSVGAETSRDNIS